MSGRGRRRRRRRPSGEGGQQPRRETAAQSQGPQNEGAQPARRSRNRRRRGRGGGERQPASPKSSEDLVRALPRERPEVLTLPPDGTTLEQVIGDLQSEHGVPQYPQEFRITLKVAEERDRERTAPDAPARTATESGRAPAVDGGPKREKAPSLRTGGETGPSRESAPGRKRRRGRRRRRGGGGGSGGAPGGAGNDGGGGNPPAGPSS
jgi:hypothetical protein